MATVKRGQAPRDRVRRILVGVNAEEREALRARAASARLSVSRYLRLAGLNHPIRSAFDQDAVCELVRVSGDLGRLGGLLKMLLSDGAGLSAETERRALDLLQEIDAARAELREKAHRV